MGEPSIDEILADPDSFTVTAVTEAFGQATLEQVEAAKALEKDGQARKGILSWEPPVSEQEPVEEIPHVNGEALYSRDRVLSFEEGTAIVGEVEALGRSVTYPEIVGALSMSGKESFTRPDLHQLIADFHAHEEA